MTEILDQQTCIDLAIALHVMGCKVISYAKSRLIFVFESRKFAVCENSDCHHDRFWCYEITDNWERSTELSARLTEELNREKVEEE
jgi:hypothetical protein